MKQPSTVFTFSLTSDLNGLNRRYEPKKISTSKKGFNIFRNLFGRLQANLAWFKMTTQQFILWFYPKYTGIIYILICPPCFVVDADKTKNLLTGTVVWRIRKVDLTFDATDPRLNLPFADPILLTY